MAQDAPWTVLFVCTGNICRSPTAEAVFRRIAAELAPTLSIEVDSAGTHDYHVGEPPDPRSIAAARRRGYDLAPLRARQVTHADFERFDLLLAMDAGHRRWLQRRAPERAQGRVQLFLEHAGVAARHEVPDPYYGGPQDFEDVLDLCEAGARGLLRAIADAPRRR